MALHQHHKKLQSRKAAIESLARLLQISLIPDKLERREPKMTPELNRYQVLLAQANALCKTVDDYLELDYIASIYQPLYLTIESLQDFVDIRI